MRVNVYEEELTERIEIRKKVAGTGIEYIGLQFFLHSSERLHKRTGDDDSSAVVFWAKDPEALRVLFSKALGTIKEKILVGRLRKMAQEKGKNISEVESEARVHERFISGAFGPGAEITSEEQDQIMVMLDDWPWDSK